MDFNKVMNLIKPGGLYPLDYSRSQYLRHILSKEKPILLSSLTGPIDLMNFNEDIPSFVINYIKINWNE